MQREYVSSAAISERVAPTFRYAVVTPARNEEDYIERTIQSVIHQTVLPERYVIVSDGSTDRTDEIVQHYADAYDFITFVRAGEAGKKKNFGSKVLAFNAGYARLADVDYDLVGNLDADVSFEPDYFERLLAKFKATPELGLSGGAVWPLYNGQPVNRNASIESVSGAVQLFRRECFEEIGGYKPMDRGGIDAAAEIMARMKGWLVRHQPDLQVIANRPVLTGQNSKFGMLYNRGIVNHRLGYHPLFQLAASARLATKRPWLLCGLCLLAGYTMSMLRNSPRAMSREAVEFLQAEQLARLGLRKSPKLQQARLQQD